MKKFHQKHQTQNLLKNQIEIITSNKEYIFNNYQLFKLILDFDLTPSKMKENFENILSDDNLLKIINTKCNQEFFEHIIFNIYDYLFMIYFTKTPANIETYIKDKNNKNQEELDLYPKLTLDINNDIKNKEKKEKEENKKNKVKMKI